MERYPLRQKRRIYGIIQRVVERKAFWYFAICNSHAKRYLRICAEMLPKTALEIKDRTNGQRRQIPERHILLQNTKIFLAPGGIVFLVPCPLSKF